MTLETKRLLIRNFTLSDAGDLYKVLSDECVMKYIEPVFSFDKTLDFILECGMCKPPLVYALEEKASGSVIGHLIFHPYENNVYELGWIIGFDNWNSGYASELTEYIIGYAGELGLAGLVIECDKDHPVSNHIALSWGFRSVENFENFENRNIYYLDLITT